MFDTKKAIEAQAHYCNEKEFPMFAPSSSGRCYRCGRNVYEEITHPDGHKTGISIEKAGSEHIVGCPHCHYSFCD